MKTSRTILLALLLLFPPAATAVGAKLLRYPKRFAEVIPGRLYRGGFPSARHIRNLKGDKHIKTVISLTGKKAALKYKQELQAVKRASMYFRRFPMPGNGCADFGQLDRAADALADALADKNGWPVFFHCDAGKQRSNAALAAYRMKKCGWTIDQALAELDEQHDLDRQAEKVLVDHLHQYSDWLNRAGQGEKSGNK